MPQYSWTDEKALNAVTGRNGPTPEAREIVARYLKFRLDGLSPDEANLKLAGNQYTLVYRHQHSGTKYRAYFEGTDIEEAIRKHRNRYVDTEIIEIRKD